MDENPYESPSLPSDASPNATAKGPSIWQTVLAGALGAAFSYFVLVVIANLENW